MNLYLRKAVFEDCDLLFNWVNDELVRQYSFNQEKILYKDHRVWFKKMINSDICIIFILCSGSIQLGQVRINIENKDAVISYSIDKNYRGNHLSIEMLSLLEKKIINNEININKLIGYVKIENVNSQKIFRSLKYKEIFYGKFYKYYKIFLQKGVL